MNNFSLRVPVLKKLRNFLTKNTISASTVNTVVGLATPCISGDKRPDSFLESGFFIALRKSLLGEVCWNGVGMGTGSYA